MVVIGGHQCIIRHHITVPLMVAGMVMVTEAGLIMANAPETKDQAMAARIITDQVLATKGLAAEDREQAVPAPKTGYRLIVLTEPETKAICPLQETIFIQTIGPV